MRTACSKRIIKLNQYKQTIVMPVYGCNRPFSSLTTLPYHRPTFFLIFILFSGTNFLRIITREIWLFEHYLSLEYYIEYHKWNAEPTRPSFSTTYHTIVTIFDVSVCSFFFVKTPLRMTSIVQFYFIWLFKQKCLLLFCFLRGRIWLFMIVSFIVHHSFPMVLGSDITYSG